MIDRMRPIVLCLLLAATVCARGRSTTSAPPAANGATLDLSGYLAALDRCSAAAARLKEHPAEAVTLKQSLPASWSVTAEGERFDVSTGWLRQDLDAFPTEPSRIAERSRQILTRLQAMRASAATLVEAERSVDRTADPAAARQHLGTILKRREFARVETHSPFRIWRDRAVGWVEDKLSRLFARISIRSGLGSLVFWVLALGLGVAMIAWLIRSILQVVPRPARPLPAGAATPEGWRRWAAEAVDRARRNEFREAIGLAYRAALYRLEEAGLWQVDDARTPREYLRLLPENHGQYPPLAALTHRFERSWYGGRAASADDFQHTVAELKDLGCLLDWKPATASS